MNTKSMNNTGIKETFDRLFEQLTEKDLIDNEARILMFRFLSIVEAKRQELGWSRKELAHKINTSPSYVTQLFRGDKLINMNTLATLQKVMGFEFEISVKTLSTDRIRSYNPAFKSYPDWVSEDSSNEEKNHTILE